MSGHRLTSVVFCQGRPPVKADPCPIPGPHHAHQHVIARCACGWIIAWRPEHDLLDAILDNVRAARLTDQHGPPP